MQTRSLSMAVPIAIAFAGLAPTRAAQAQTPVIGRLDGVYYTMGYYHVYGWACEQYSATPVSVVATAYSGDFDQGYWVWTQTAMSDKPSEPAVAEACGVPGATNFRYDIPVSYLTVSAFPGYSVAVQGISNDYCPMNESGTYVCQRYMLPYSNFFPDDGFPKCGCIDAQWSAPRGSLVLISSRAGFVRTIVDQLGEYYTHEMVVQGPDSASQSEYQGPKAASSCNYPLDINSLQFGLPGMEKSMNSGAIFAELYGNGSLAFSQSGAGSALIWQLGDAARGEAIAAALDAKPWTDYASRSGYGEYVHRLLRNGATSPYGLYQYMNIEGTFLGEGGRSLNNSSVSSTFCAYAYALGGPAMSSYNYGHNETQNAANALWSKVYNDCMGGTFPWFISWFSIPCSTSTICNNASNMVINCTATGNCGDNSSGTWQSAMAPVSAHAYTISPDRLGGHTRFSTELPRPTTWARDTAHTVVWNAAGMSCGCYE